MKTARFVLKIVAASLAFAAAVWYNTGRILCESGEAYESTASLCTSEYHAQGRSRPGKGPSLGI